MGSDLSVVNAARVSFHKESCWAKDDTCGNTELSLQDQKLITYLAKHGHWTPFAHCFATFRVKVPMFVAMQLDKHTVGFATNSVSRRYVDEEPEMFVPQLRLRAENVKQGSSKEILQATEEWDFAEQGNSLMSECVSYYNSLLHEGVAPEVARGYLPMNTMMERIWSGSLAAWGRFCKLREDSHSQYETQVVANQVRSELMTDFPVSLKALLEN